MTKTKVKLLKGEKIIQIMELDVYHIGLTNKGRVLQLDIFEGRPSLKQEGVIFITGELKIK